MLIDWFTVGAQVVNFLILVWLLKHFLYHPVLAAIDAREQGIAKTLADAATSRAEALKEKESFQSKNEEVDKQREGLLDQARNDAAAQRQRLLEEARKAVEDLRARQQESLRTEALGLRLSLTRRAQQEVFAISRKALGDLADASLEARMVAVLARRLAALSEADKAALRGALQGGAGQVIVRSAFELAPVERIALGAVMEEALGVTPSFSFETTPEVIGGIELVAGGQKLAWSIDDYLTSLQAGVDELLQGQAAAPAPAAPTSVTPAVTTPDRPAPSDQDQPHEV